MASICEPVSQYSTRSITPFSVRTFEIRLRSPSRRFSLRFSSEVRARYGFPSPAHNKKTAGLSGTFSISPVLTVAGGRMT